MNVLGAENNVSNVGIRTVVMMFVSIFNPKIEKSNTVLIAIKDQVLIRAETIVDI